MDVLWMIVYWGNFLQGSLVTKFYQTYWVSGHFSVASRVKATLRQFLIQIIVASIIVVVLAALAFFFMKDFLQKNQERFI